MIFVNFIYHKMNFQRIEVSDQKTLQLQFNQTFGFGIEYHRNCAFDKIHVFDQNDNSRLARFCGPKDDLPYDGARKLRAIDGELEMWDLPFDKSDKFSKKKK